MTFFLHGGRRDILKIISKWIDQDSTYFSDFMSQEPPDIWLPFLPISSLFFFKMLPVIF